MRPLRVENKWRLLGVEWMLFSTNDFKVLGDALKKRRQITLARTMGPITAEVETVHLPEAWETDMGVRVRIEWGWLTWLQTFDNVDAARQMIKDITGT